MGGKPRRKPQRTYTLSLEINQEQYESLQWLMRKRKKTENEYLYEAIKALVDTDCHLIAHVERMMRHKHKPSEVQLHVLGRMAKGDEIRYDGTWYYLGSHGKVARTTMKILEDCGYVAWNVGLEVWRITEEGKSLVSRNSGKRRR